jgi:hypothetical protein
MGVGDVVGYSTFDFDIFEDENWAENCDSTDNGCDQCRYGNAGGAKLEIGRPRTKHGKMEKSFFNFKVCSK